MLVWLLVACGGSVELGKPHDPPAWPMENLLARPPAPVPAPPAAPAEDTDTDAPPAPPEAP